MISIAFASDQLERLAGMVGFPRGKEAESYVREMRTAIQTAENEGIAEQAVSDILREFRRCPAVADLYEAMRNRNESIATEEPIRRENYRCSRCQDCGFYGGHIGGRYAGPWKWCDCAASWAKQAGDPHLVDDSNVVREKLLHKFPSAKGRSAPADPMRPVQEIYYGEF